MRMRYGHRTQARILVADWDRNNALSLAAVMHMAGFKTATAFNGKEAVEKAATFLPDLLVTEAYLGRVSGIQAAAGITAALPDCKVLFLSCEASITDIAKAAPEGLVYSYTPKPLHPLDLLNAIASLLSAEWSADDRARQDDDKLQPAPGQNAQAAGSSTMKAANAAATQNRDADAICLPALL